MAYSPPELIVEHDAGKDIIYEIGVLVATAANTDWELGRQILRMISAGAADPNEYAEPLVPGMDFKVKLAIIRLLARVFDDEKDTVRVQRLCDKLQDLYQRRNDVAHLTISQRKGSAAHFHSFKIDPRTGARAPAKTYTAKQIRGWAEQMEWWAIALDLFLHRYELPESEWPLDPVRERALKSAMRLLDRSDQPSGSKPILMA